MSAFLLRRFLHVTGYLLLPVPHLTGEAPSDSVGILCFGITIYVKESDDFCLW
jgi:hypothetical protein